MMDATINTQVDDDTCDKELDLMEHLSELRTRLIRSILYVAIGMAVTWIWYDFFFRLLSAPVLPILKQKGGQFIVTGITEGFTIKLQMCVIIGLILVLPLVTMEMWGFVAPGLTRAERRAVKLVAPLSILLFISGVVVAYYALPAGAKWLVDQIPSGATFMPKIQDNLLFIMRMYLGFGLVFQLPVVLMFLAKVGLVTSKTLKSYWRQAVVILCIIAAAVTPSGDAITMMMLCAPLIGLYLLSIALVSFVENR
jgi:sec-independent protein translocase protein TatC